MPDIFNIDQNVVNSNVARGDTFLVQVAGGNTIFLAQNVTVSYNRPVQNLYSLGSKDVSISTGRPSGTLQIARVIGTVHGASSNTLRDVLGDPFFDIAEGDAPGGTLKFKPLGGDGYGGVDAVPDANFKCTGCVVVGEQFGGSAQDVIILESVQIQFIAMET